MKIIKKNICLIAILSGVVGLSACSQDDALTPDSGTDNGNTIRFTTAIAGFTGSDAAADPATRATINDDGKGSFNNGDKTEIFIAHEDRPESAMIYPAIFRNGTWEADNLTWEGFGNSAELNFFAFSRHAPTWKQSKNSPCPPTRAPRSNTPPPTCFMPPPSTVWKATVPFPSTSAT